MNAANFTTFSTGIGSHGFVLGQKYLHDYPNEFYRMRSMGLMKQLPTNKADKDLDKPAYVFDVKYSMSASIIAETMNPKLGQLTRNDPEYKYRMYHAACPLLVGCVGSPMIFTWAAPSAVALKKAGPKGRLLLAVSAVMARAVPPLAIPPASIDDLSAAISPREAICGEITYRLGGNFWPSRASAKLHGDLLLIHRRSRQEAAVQLTGASVEMQGSCSIKIEAPGTPVLVMRLDNSSDTERWLSELQHATQRSRSYREMLRDVPLLSPRSEVASTPSETLTAELQGLRNRLAQEEATTREMEMNMRAANLRADAAQQSLRDARERAHGVEKAMQQEQDKRKMAEAQLKELQAHQLAQSESHQALLQEKTKLQEAEKHIQELQNKLASASLQGKALLEEQQKRRQAETAIKELQSKLENVSSHEKATLEEQEKCKEEMEKRKQAEATVQEQQVKLESHSSELQGKLEQVSQQEAKIKELQDQLEEQVSKSKELQDKLEDQASKAKDLEDRMTFNETSQETDAASQLQLLQTRLTRMEQRLQGEEQRRKVAEESKAGAERRLAEMELVLQNVKKPGEVNQTQTADDEASKKKLKAAEERIQVLQARAERLEEQLSELATESKAQMIELHDQWLSKEHAAKAASDAQLEALQTELAFQRAEVTEKERKELKGAIDSERAAKEAVEVKLQAAQEAEETKKQELETCKAQAAQAASDFKERIQALEAELRSFTLSVDLPSSEKTLELQEQIDKLEGEAGDLRRRLGAAEQRFSAEQHRRQTAEARTQDMEARLTDLEEVRSMTRLQGQLEAAMVKASREAQAKNMAQRQLVAALKAATAAGAKIKAAEAWMKNPGPDDSKHTERIAH
ncbi:unnamed protein product [Cladocopium goreaui]|uniref:PH domain-containing protein n=1 Tax=Cladocopium goreaui TaxID=2562237 RepID=A0A9P1FQH1_9DINO|nr:unnamed protein product [Cladocopium goreaui]